ncbi:MAG TPA: DnaA N-terminal domain-containing protein, partial [Candidatus Paceibacterota bacterium]
MLDLDKIWRDALTEIELSVSRANFITWFRNTSLSRYENKIVYIDVPNAFVKEWHSDKYCREVLRILRSFIPEAMAV